jgi:hypothetical protein
MIVSLISEAPKSPGIYALCAGHGKRRYVAYVGLAKNIQQRLRQHLVRRDSSIVTGASAVSLDPDKVTEVRWWVHPLFDRYMPEAEIVAFRVLDPVLRSRQQVSPPVEYVANRDDFRQEIEKVLSGPPTGRLEIPTYEDVVRRVAELEQKVRTVPAYRGQKGKAEM